MHRREFCNATLAGAAVALSGSSLVLNASEATPKRFATDLPAVKLSGAPTVIEKAALAELASSLNGGVIVRGAADYDTARRVWNGMIDKHPALIVQCADAADVSKAVTFARERELLLAVRGGGHSFPGLSTCDGGMLLSLAGMRTVSVDPERRLVTAGGGAWGRDVDDASQKYGLATPMGQISDTGIGGLTLGGGFSWISRRYGLACDNLESVDLVTADGEIRRVGRGEHPDLDWAIRGGGGNFGVVTSFTYRLHPVGLRVLAGRISYAPGDARAVLDFFGNLPPGTSRDLSYDFSLYAGDDGAPSVSINVVCIGDPEAGRKALDPFLTTVKPVRNDVQLRYYQAVQRQFDAPTPSPYRHYVKGGLISEFSPALIDEVTAGFRLTPAMQIYMQNSSGAVGDIEPAATAFWNRQSKVNLMILGEWSDPAADEANRAAIRDAWKRLAPFTDGYYVNLGDADTRKVDANFGGNYARLVDIKRRYDPGNLFRLNTNIAS